MRRRFRPYGASIPPLPSSSSTGGSSSSGASSPSSGGSSSSSLVVSVDSVVVVVLVELSVVLGTVEVVVVLELVELSPLSPLAITSTAISRPTITAIRPAISQRLLLSRSCGGRPPGPRSSGPIIRVGSSCIASTPPVRESRRESRSCPRSRTGFGGDPRSPPCCCRRPPAALPGGGHRRHRRLWPRERGRSRLPRQPPAAAAPRAEVRAPRAEAAPLRARPAVRDRSETWLLPKSSAVAPPRPATQPPDRAARRSAPRAR